MVNNFIQVKYSFYSIYIGIKSIERKPTLTYLDLQLIIVFKRGIYLISFVNIFVYEKLKCTQRKKECHLRVLFFQHAENSSTN